MLSPFAPHLAEELWEYTGHSLSVFNESWPTVDKTALIKEEINITVQINGRVRFNFTISKDASEKDVTNQAISSVEKYLTNKKIIKTILVPNKLVNIVVSD